MKQLLLFCFLLYSCTPKATDFSSECGGIETFYPYKAGIQAEKNNLTTEAFIIFCNLALKGDYRAQFKLARHYYEGIPELFEPDYEFAYIWSRLSNNYAVSKKKTKFSEEVYQHIRIEDRDRLNLKLQKALKIIPTGARIDMLYEPIDYVQLIKSYNEKNAKKRFTGSRIKRDEPILNTRIFDFQ